MFKQQSKQNLKIHKINSKIEGKVRLYVILMAHLGRRKVALKPGGGTSLAVQWLRLTFTIEGIGLIPGQGT